MIDFNSERGVEEKLAAIVALLAALVEKQPGEKTKRVEIILSDAGLSPTKIARLLGKKPDTVIKTIKRKDNQTS